MSEDLGIRLREQTVLFLKSLRGRGYSEATLKVYRSDLKKLAAWFSEKSELAGVQDIGRAELLEYASHLLTEKSSRGKPWSGMTRSRHLSTVKSFFRFLTKSGLLLSDPASALEGVKAQRRLPKVPSVEEVLRLLAAIDTGTVWGLRNRAAVELLYGSGFRISEILNLDVHDVDLEQGLVHIARGKGGRPRVVPLTPESVKALKAYIEQRGNRLGSEGERALFLSRAGSRMQAYGFSVELRKYAEQAKVSVKITPHVLRHACATHLLKGQANIRQIQALLGHASLSTTQVYTRVEISDLAEVVKRCHPREKL